eukprot:1138326-Pelagomonas_calceolata.AAC.5
MKGRATLSCPWQPCCCWPLQEWKTCAVAGPDAVAHRPRAPPVYPHVKPQQSASVILAVAEMQGQERTKGAKEPRGRLTLHHGTPADASCFTRS